MGQKKIDEVIKFKCIYCETENPDNARYCQECGESLKETGERTYDNIWIVAAILMRS